MLYKIQHVTWCGSFIDYFFNTEGFPFNSTNALLALTDAQELYINTVRMIALVLEGMESHV